MTKEEKKVVPMNGMIKVLRKHWTAAMRTRLLAILQPQSNINASQTACT